MPREVFPFTNQREAIKAYLRGETLPGDGDPFCYVDPNGVGLVVGQSERSCATFDDSDGSLKGWLNMRQVDMHYAVKAQNYILEVLGDPRRITMKPVVRSVAFAGQTADQTMAPHLDDVELPVNAPWTIAGRLTILAWRAEQDNTTVVE